MYLLTQLWLYLLAACVLGVVIGLTVRARRWQAQTQRTLQQAEFRHTEQMVSVSAEHESVIAALEMARHEANLRFERSTSDVQELQARLAERDKQLKDLSSMLMRVNNDLAKAEAQRRSVLQDRQRAVEEVEVLRKQVAAGRSELAQLLGQHEREVQGLQEQLRKRPVLAEGGAVEAGVEAAVPGERDTLMQRLGQMANLLDHARRELGTRVSPKG
jgi:chromosome segregation ATPase